MTARTHYVYDNAEHNIENGVAQTQHHEGQSFSDSERDADFENLPTDTCLGCDALVQFKLVMGIPVAFEMANETRLSLTVPHICPDED